MKRLARKLPGGLMFGALVFGSLVNGVATAEEVVGAVNTQLRVTEQGAASFSIPINLLQARGGVRPELALAYDSSQLAAGVAGIGWSLSGSQSIHRCPPTPYHDGRIDAVNYSSGDRFCLNGQRLRLVSGKYGASGSRYAVVNQPGWRISAHGGNSASVCSRPLIRRPPPIATMCWGG